ncbi:phage integrase SAM-like domain-containing protein [Planktosalinus lacus]|uniref:Transposase n=1 Tax=Planktosalinus lacus TaxID=1526573 RepID=A0A8J2V8Y5_9FLAO|nr:phage integrase SAM-like domain-containing protein [Planktosalinus lacus]GGD85927.1 transposase [Planktosalinus lacus]
MATIRFFTKRNNNPSTIYLRFKAGRKYDFTKSTSLLIDPKYWNNNKGSVKQIAEFNDKQKLQNDLNSLKTKILNGFNGVYEAGGIINPEWLQSIIQGHFNQNDNKDFNLFVDYAEYFKDNLNNKVLRNGRTGVKENTLKRYVTIINKIKEFEAQTKKRLRLIDIDLKFYKDFKDFLVNNQKLNLNTTGRYIVYIKTICLDAKEYGLKISQDIEKKEFRETKEETTFVTFTENEINKIFEHDFSNTPYLENARDWLIIGIWTGARVSDLLSFTNENIENGFIEYTSVKTDQKIIIPLHHQVQETLEKNNGQFPRKITSQKFNDYIKAVCSEVKINTPVKGSLKVNVTPDSKTKVFRKRQGVYKKSELVSSHICRRTFATFHYGKLPTPVLMAITGHTTEKMFLKYIGKTAKDNAETLNEFWKVQQSKKERKPQLDIIKTGTNNK